MIFAEKSLLCCRKFSAMPRCKLTLISAHYRTGFFGKKLKISLKNAEIIEKIHGSMPKRGSWHGDCLYCQIFLKFALSSHRNVRRWLALLDLYWG